MIRNMMLGLSLFALMTGSALAATPAGKHASKPRAVAAAPAGDTAKEDAPKADAPKADKKKPVKKEKAPKGDATKTEGAKEMKAAQTDPLAALSVQVARALQPDARDIERARLIAMALAASRGDMDAFWTARRMRTQPKAGGKTARKK